MKQYDVVTFGETMLRFTPPGFSRFEQSPTVEIHVGGSESNTAVGLSRLGHSVAWFSRLTENPVGKLIARSLATHDVDISHICWTHEDRIGTYYMERGKMPRGSELFYDRAGSAVSRIGLGDIPKELFRENSLRIFHTTGITLGISDAAAAAAEHAASLAKRAGALVSFDVNFRSKLWTPEQARNRCGAFADLADFIFLPLRDAQTLFQIDTNDARQAALKLHQRWRQATVVITLGEAGAIAVDSQGSIVDQAAFASEEIERLGRGDAFTAGFLSGYLGTEDNQVALRWGAAAAAVKSTITGDLPVFDRRTVEQIVASGVEANGITR